MPKPPPINLGPVSAPAVPPVVMQPDKRPQRKAMAPTFLGPEATPMMTASASGMGGKTLLGA